MNHIIDYLDWKLKVCEIKDTAVINLTPNILDINGFIIPMQDNKLVEFINDPKKLYLTNYCEEELADMYVEYYGLSHDIYGFVDNGLENLVSYIFLDERIIRAFLTWQSINDCLADMLISVDGVIYTENQIPVLSVNSIIRHIYTSA